MYKEKLKSLKEELQQIRDGKYRQYLCSNGNGNASSEFRRRDLLNYVEFNNP